MKKVVFCIIAHPDDEAFGPSGTLSLLARKHDVHVLCVTDGASDPRFHAVGGKKLSDIRTRELEASADILGVKKIHYLHFQDGSLNNNTYHDIAKKLQTLVDSHHPNLLITTELRGVSGHIDHVAVSMVTSFIYEKNPKIDAIWYNCTSREVSDTMRDYFIYFPHGFTREEVDMVVDISGVFTQKLAAAACHASQKNDVDRTTTRWLKSPKEEWFFVEKRRDTMIAS